MKKDIGITKSKVGFSFLLILITIAFILTFICMWWGYTSQPHYKYLSENAIEVEATIAGYGIYYYSDNSEYHCTTYYEYESESGTVYRNSYATYSTIPEAEAHIGDKVKVYVDPNSDWTAKLLPAVNYEGALNNAIIWSIPVPFVLYLLIYRCIYRNVMNKKILKKVYGNTYNNDKFMHTPQPNTVKQAEVTKVWKWIVCYVKVKYQDENFVTREKWARAWFTHREAKFLKQKKFINIVPYKNTYGIFEEMPTKKRSHKEAING